MEPQRKSKDIDLRSKRSMVRNLIIAILSTGMICALSACTRKSTVATQSSVTPSMATKGADSSNGSDTVNIADIANGLAGGDGTAESIQRQMEQEEIIITNDSFIFVAGSF